MSNKYSKASHLMTIGPEPVELMIAQRAIQQEPAHKCGVERLHGKQEGSGCYCCCMLLVVQWEGRWARRRGGE